MNRLLLSCLLFLSILLPRIADSQTMVIWTTTTGATNSSQCFDPNGNTGFGHILAPPNNAKSFTWTVVPPAGCSSTSTFQCDDAVCDTITNINYPCCGAYTIGVAAIDTVNNLPVIITTASAVVTIVCPNTATATAANSVICLGDATSLTGNGAQTYTWYPAVGTPTTGNPINITTSSTTCYTMVGTTAASQGGCTVTASTCVSVQAASVAVTPTAQTMCIGSNVCFTASPMALGGSSVTPGTATTGLQWYDPNGNPFPGGITTCTGAIGGNYKVVLTHTGSAGTCTTEALSAVVISTFITTSASGHSTSVCPNANLTLTAVSIQTAAASYTWSGPGGFSVVGNPVVVQPSVATCYTVNVDYTGCPGQATVCVGMATLTPTLTASSPSICPGTAVTLSATGGSEYTFVYVNTPSVIGTASTSASSITHTPTSASGFPPAATYSVGAYSGGCSGGAVITIFEYPLSPTFGALGGSVCPNSTITFTAGNVGALANYTALAGYSSTPIYTGTSNSFTHALGTNSLSQTYTLHVDSAGCTGSVTTTINGLTLTPVLSSSTGSICPATQFTLQSTGGASTSFSFYTGNNAAPGATNIIGSGTSYSITHTPTLALPLTYTVKVDSSNCVGTGTFELGQLDLSPSLSLSASPGISVCPGSTFTISANLGAGTNYTFSAPSGTIPMTNSNSATHTLSANELLPGAKILVIGDSLGCQGRDSITMYRYTINPTLTASPDPVCAGMPVVLQATGGANTKYTFLKPSGPPFFVAVVGNSLTTSNTVTDTPGPTSGITYTVAVDSTQCTGFATYSITIAPGLTVNALASSPTVCSGQTATLSATGPTNSTYSWTQITGTNNPVPVAGGTALNYTQVTQGITVNPTVSTQYIVSAVDPAGCTGSAVVTVSINPTASLNISLAPQNTTICPGQSATLTASGGNSYTWAPPGGLLPSSTVPTVVASPSVTQTYTVLGTNNLGCYGSKTITVHVGLFPNITFAAAPAPSVCPGFNATLTAFGANTFTWTSTTFTGSIIQQSVAGGPGTYSVVGSNGGTCLDSSFTTIGIAPNLTINVAQSTPTTCIANNFPKFSHPVTFTASGAGSYVWQPYNPAHMTYSLGPITTVRPPATTCYTVTGYTSICSGTAVVCTTVIPQFSMNVTPPRPAICLGDSVKLGIANIGTQAHGPVSAYTYSWAEAENAPPISMSDFLTPTITVYPQNTTTYTVEVKDSKSCASLPRLVTVSVFPRPITSVSVPTINGVPTRSLCYVGLHTGPPDVVLTLVASNTNPNLPFGVTPTYTWMQPYPFPHNSILTPPNSDQVTVSAPERTPTIAIYTVVSGYNGVPGCAEMDTVHVRVVDCRPVSTVTGTIWKTAEAVDTICVQDCITFMALTDTMAGGPQTYEWQFKGGNPPTSTEKNPSVCYNLPNQEGWDIILRVTNPYPKETGGSAKVIGLRHQVKVTDIPNVTIVDPGNIRSDTTVRFGTPVNLNASGALWYSWTPNYNITSLTDASVTVKPFRTTRYILTGYNSRNCISRDTIDVIVIEDCGEMYVPNAFSPNGDGHNDVLKVNGICLETMSFMIFNRWGEKVFESTDQSVGWDGTFHGELMNTGVFVYRLEGKTFDGKAYSSKGNITLIR